MPLVCEQIGACTLYQGDAREVLASLFPYDALVTDPPYGIPSGARHGLYACPTRKWPGTPWMKGTTIFPGSINTPVDTTLLSEYLTLAKWGIIWGGQFFDLEPSPGWLVWNKLTTGQLSDCELAWTNLPREGVRQFTYLWNGFQKAHPEERFHPTQKPLTLMLWCLEQLPKTSRHIADPFMGSGTTGVACVQLGRSFVGVEIDPRYFDLACRRIEAATKQLSLFPPAPMPTPPQQLLLTGATS